MGASGFGCRSVGAAEELQRLELRVQELAAENARLRGGWHVPQPSSPQQSPEERAAARWSLGNEPADDCLWAPEPGSADSQPAAAPGPAAPALLPEDLDAMLAAAAPPAPAPRGARPWRKSQAQAAKPAEAAAVSVQRALAAGRLPGMAPDTQVAVRITKPSGDEAGGGLGQDQQLRFLQEVQMLNAVRHENLMPVLAMCVPRLALVYPWAEKGNLGDLLRSAPPDPSEGFHILLDTARGLCALHDRRLVHRDIKSDAVFLFPALGGGIMARLGNCGWVCRSEDSGSDTSQGAVVGTPPYTDPLHLFTGRFSLASDIFSLGVVLLEVLFGRSAAQLAEPGARSDLQLRPEPRLIRAGDAQHAATGTRRPRAQPLWMQFEEQLPPGQDPAEAAANLVAAKRPLPCWSRRALTMSAGIATEMVRVDWGESRAAEALGRPTAVAVVEHLEVAAALQDAGSTLQPPPRRERICVVCMDERIGTQLLPCRHSALCQSCASLFVGRREACPICRQRVTGYDEGEFNATFAH